GDARGFGIPLIPADENADVSVPRFPYAEAAGAFVVAVVREVRVTRSEIKLLVEQRIIGDVHLPICAEQRAIGIDHRGGVPVHAGRLPLEDRYDNYHLELTRQRSHPFDGRTRNR